MMVVALFALCLSLMGWTMVTWMRAALTDEIDRRNTELLARAVQLPELRNPFAETLELSQSSNDKINGVAGGSSLILRLTGPVASNDPMLISGNALSDDVKSTEYYVTTVRLQTGNGPAELSAYSPLVDVQQSVELLKRSLYIAVPALVAAVGVLAWAMTGRALSPVNAITRRVRDISSRTLYERVPVPHTRDEIEALARTMNQMLDRLEESSGRERQFLANASHELRSPVAAIRAQIETAMAYPDPDRWQQVGSTVLAQGSRLEDLVSNLFALTRLDESAGREMHATDVDMDELVMESTRHVTRARLDLSRVGAARVLGDVQQLESVVRNLVDNAARHAESVVHIELTTEGETALLAVEDDGPGVPQDQREQVFKRFVRLEEGRSRDSGGAGLGLSLVREIVERHGGEVHLADAKFDGATHGARFEVRLPLEIDEDDEDDDSPDE